MAHNITGFQGITLCIQYLDSNPHKPIFYPYNYYDGSNVIRLTWSGNQVEDYTTHNCLECHKDEDHAIIINRRRSVSGIIRFVPAQNVHFFYTRSHLSALQNRALLFSIHF